MGTLLRSDNFTDSLPFQEWWVRPIAKSAYNSELGIYDVNVQLFLSQDDKLKSKKSKKVDVMGIQQTCSPLC